MRWRILSFSRFSVSDTLTVRSKGSSPEWTRLRVSTTWRRAPSHSRTLRRKRLRVTSIFLARAISSLRVSSGMLPICVRYMRTGSSMRRPSSSSMKERSRSAPASASAAAAGGRAFAVGDVFLVDQLDALLFEHEDELIELFGVDGVVRQVIVDLGEGQVALFLALVEQGLQALVDLLHQTLRWGLQIDDCRLQICPSNRQSSIRNHQAAVSSSEAVTIRPPSLSAFPPATAAASQPPGRGR